MELSIFARRRFIVRIVRRDPGLTARSSISTPYLGATVVAPGHARVLPLPSEFIVTLNLLAFTFHVVAQIAVLAWKNAVAARGASYRFFEHMRTITAHIVFPDWLSLLTAIANPKARPP